MFQEGSDGADRREFIRLDHVTPLVFKVCKKETISKMLEGYTSNVSASGIFCHIKEKVQKDDILWLSFDKATMTLCEDLEKMSLIYQNGVIGKVVRIEDRDDGSFSVGLKFITRQEPHLGSVFSKIYGHQHSEAHE